MSSSPGYPRYTTLASSRIRSKSSGVFEELSGPVFGLLIENTDLGVAVLRRAIKDLFRLGHADYTYGQKYGLRVSRRRLLRETAMRAAAGGEPKSCRESSASSFRLPDEDGDILATTRRLGSG